MKEGGYAGKIKNGGTQVVQAPKQTTDQKKGTVKKGSLLPTAKLYSPHRRRQPAARTGHNYARQERENGSRP